MYYANSFQNFIIMNNGFITRTVQFRRQLGLKETRPVPSDFRVHAKQSCTVGHTGLAETPGAKPWAPVAWPHVPAVLGSVLEVALGQDRHRPHFLLHLSCPSAGFLVSVSYLNLPCP